MSTLVGYTSSDEDNDTPPIESKMTPVKASSSTHQPQTASGQSSNVPSNEVDDVHTIDANKARARAETHAAPIAESSMGPIAGPTIPTIEDGLDSEPSSPFSSNRALVRNLTLPTVPNLDIPASPPGSPPPGLDSRLENFLRLKRQGMHFNEKLASSSALKNPSLLDKLLQSTSMHDHDQYGTTLPAHIWSSTDYPAWAYKDELSKAQKEAQKLREEELAKGQRGHIEFISESASQGHNRPVTLHTSRANSKGSAAERVMAGLDRDKT